MKALLLAAGLGTRLRPVTNFLPKCLVSIREKPLLQYWLDLLLPDFSEKIIINTHYFSAMVESFIKQSTYADRITLVYEPDLLGTGGTILKNQALLKDGPFLLAHADNLTRFNPNAFATAHANRAEGVEITMMTFDTDVPERCGIVEQDERGRVMGFHEKSRENYGTRANAAVYILEPSVVSFLASLGQEVIDLSTEVIPHYLGKIQTYHNADYHRDIGTPESLQLAEVEY